MEAKRFILAINLGNEAMNCDNDIAEALRKVALGLEGRCFPCEVGEMGRIFDENGNRVGGWHTDGGE